MVSIQWKRGEVTALITCWFNEIVSWKIFKTKNVLFLAPSQHFPSYLVPKWRFRDLKFNIFWGSTDLLVGALTFLPKRTPSKSHATPLRLLNPTEKSSNDLLKTASRATNPFADVTMSDIEEAALDNSFIHWLEWQWDWVWNWIITNKRLPRRGALPRLSAHLE